jgi:spore coat protein U-like protein
VKNVLRNLLPIICLLFSAKAYAFSCTISTTPVNFGTYDVFSMVPRDSTGTITVDCKNPEKKPLPVTVSINQGSSGSFNPRQMTSPLGDRLNYYLFIDSSRSSIWGDGTGGSSTFIATVSKNAILNSTVYGRVPAGQNISVGTYTDTLTATVIW